MTTVREAERDAADLLASSWWVSDDRDWPLPVDPFTLARGLGIYVSETFLPADQSGNIRISATGSAIEINWLDNSNRQRFTCAHEVGHHVLRHKRDDLRDAEVIIDERAQLAGAGVDSDEIYANQFAAALLMPAHLVARGVRDKQSPEALARRFETSVQAMNLRLRNLNLA